MAPLGAVLVEDADDDDALFEPVALLPAEVVGADAQRGRRRDEEGELAPLARADALGARELVAPQLLVRRRVVEDVVPVDLPDGPRAPVPERDLVAEAVARRPPAVARGLEDGRVGARLAADAVHVGAAAAALGVIDALLVARAHAHLVEVLDGAAEGVALPVDALLAPAELEDGEVGRGLLLLRRWRRRRGRGLRGRGRESAGQEQQRGRNSHRSPSCQRDGGETLKVTPGR